MKTQPEFPLERLLEIKANPKKFALLERVPEERNLLNLRLALREGDERPIVFLDTETTGLDPAKDRIIQLGMVIGFYSPGARTLQSLTASFCAYEDPGFPIPEMVELLTGITDDDVRGQRFDDSAVERFLAADPLIVAHNAWFDRPFFERRFPNLDNLRWACSCKEVDWRKHGFEGAGLGALVMQAGGFFSGHRAADDCLALAWLLHREYGAFEEMVSTAAGLTYVVEAWKAPIRCKDELKGRKYQWDADRRVWHKSDVVDLDAELDFLDSLYECARKVAVYKPQTARERFKKTLPRLVVANV